MKSLKVLVVTAIILSAILCCALPGACRIIYVNTARPDDLGDGLSWGTAKKKIQSGLDLSVAGDNVWVATGTYSELITLKIGVALYGGFPAVGGDWSTRDFTSNVTVIDGMRRGMPITSPPDATSSTRVDGFTVCNAGGTTSVGVGIYCGYSSPTICNNVITRNQYGVGCQWSSPTITCNTIADNSAGGVLCRDSSSPVICGNKILRNTGLGISCGSTSSPLIACNVIASNTSGGIACSASSPNIVNNTIVGNCANEGDGSTVAAGGIIASSASALVVANNIVAFNSSGIRRYDSASSILLHSNCVWNPDSYNYKGTMVTDTDLSVDPHLVPAALGRYHIQPDSPCIDAGNDGLAQEDWSDIDGQARKQDGDADGSSAVDIGADESDGTTWAWTPVVIRVATTGNDSNTGLDWEHPKLTLQVAVDVAAEHTGQVWVAKGNYAAGAVLRDGVSVYGGFAGGETQLDQRNWSQNVSALDGGMSIAGGMMTQVQLDGLTIQGSISTPCVLCTGGSPVISHNRILGGSEGNGITVTKGTPVISGNLIAACGRRGISCSRAAATISGNTLVGNADAAIYSEYAVAVVCNNIVAHNASGIECKSGGTQPELRNNCVYNPGGTDYSNLPAGATDISQDPKLDAVTYGQLHLLATSPCIDAGDSAFVQEGAVDWDGASRISGACVDIGADEFDGTQWSYVPPVVRVSPEGADTNDGSSWALAKKTVQAGVDAATLTGGDVWVAAGIYSGSITARRFVGLYGGFAGNESSRAERDRKTNLTILHGSSSGPVVKFAGLGFRTGTLDGFTIRNGSKGVSCSYSSPVISSNLITQNSGAGVWCSYAHPAILNNTILRNVDGGGVYCSYSSAVIANNFVVANSSTSSSACGIYCTNSANAVISNNTIVGNAAPNGGLYAAGCSVSNNIVAFNSAGMVVGQKSSHNCIYNPGASTPADAPGPSDIAVAPGLVAWQSGEVHLRQDSPCIDAGDDGVRQGNADIDGDLRLFGDHIDIGADEANGSPWVYTPRIMRVSPTGDDANDGSDWSHAKKTVQAGIDVVTDSGGEVWVAQGTYYERIGLKNFAHVYGGFAGAETLRSERNWATNPTILDGQALGSVVTSDSGFRSSTIDGFVIRNGKGTSGGGIRCTYGAPVISNNTITANRAGRGGGIECDNTSPLIVNNVITGNAANTSYSDGGGIDCNSTYAAPTVVNNTIVSNIAKRGGGIYCSSSNLVRVTNNIIALNSSGIAGQVDLRNNCFYNPDGPNYSVEPTPGQNNFVADPRLECPEYGKVHILVGSPCIDAGMNTSPWETALDIDSLARVVGEHIDIGADEYDGTQWQYSPTAVRVDPAGNDANDGSTWLLAKKTVQAGADAASIQGGEVWVAAGTYAENVYLKPFVSLYGGFSGDESAKAERDWRANSAVIDGRGTGSSVTVELGCRSAVIDGFTIRNGYTAGITCNLSSPTISNNTISENSGQGISLDSVASPNILGNAVVANGGNGVGAGQYYTGEGGMVANNVVAGNGGIGITVTPVVVNNTVCGNNGGGIHARQLTANNIVAFNAWGIWLAADQTVVHNCVYNPDGDDYTWNDLIQRPAVDPSNLSVDPRLAAAQYGRMHLVADSPCIGAGLDSAVRGLTDVDGDSRILGPRVDIGADEWNGVLWSGEPRVVRVSLLGDDLNSGSSWADAKKTIQAAIDSAVASGGEVWVAAGSYTEQITMRPFVHTYGGFHGNEASRNQRQPGANVTTLVSPSGSCTVYLDKGFLVNTVDGFTIRGGSPGIYCYNCSSTISHNVITGNAGGIRTGASGSRIEFNTITANTGRGIDSSGSSIIRENQITNNSGSYGTGIYCGGYSPVLIARNLISGNQALTDHPSAGGIFCAAPATIRDNLITGNSAYSSAGIVCSGTNDTVSVVNNTIVGNTSTNGSGAFNCSCSANISNNIIAYNTGGITRSTVSSHKIVLRNNDFYNPGGANYTLFDPGQGDISADPLFVDRSHGDCHIAPNSPCINTGWNEALGLPQFDIDGQWRLAGPVVDIGADEYWGAARIDEAKRFGDGAPVQTNGMFVTASFLNSFYIESPDRITGIRVDKLAHGTPVGAKTDVTGTVQTNTDGERYIAASSIARIGTGSLTPLALSNARLGGGAYGLQSGITGAFGLNNIGLLIKTWGRFTKTGDTSFTIDDGSALSIKCIVENGQTLNPSWTYVTVTGISSCEKTGSELRSVVRVLNVTPM